MSITITTCYRFLNLTGDDQTRIQRDLEKFAEQTGLRGLVLVGPEGVNMTVSGTPETIAAFKPQLAQCLNLQDLVFKDSKASKHPFLMFKVKIKKEIVTLKRPGLTPPAVSHHHMSPSEWHEAVQDPESVVIDTRNDYEVEIGKFKTAIEFGIKEFHDFPEALRKAQIEKDRKVLIYCTGGIRCEKAILAMEEEGYSNVHQLDGGILNYLKEYPNGQFDGECFVFDYRVAVDQDLAPSQRYKLCPHCGQAAEEKITCSQCQTEAIICHHCEGKGVTSCSKNCAHHKAIGSRSSHPQLLSR